MPARLAVLCGTVLLAAAGGAVADPMEGRELFHGFRPFAGGVAATANRLPPAFAACAACHGPLGLGDRLVDQPKDRPGGAPPLAAGAAWRPRGALPAFASDRAVLAAITEGLGRTGAPLDGTMPRYTLTEAEAGALLGYLRRAGTGADLPPGVGPDRILLGTLLPLSGPGAAAGAAVLAGLLEAFEAANAGGGVYGRRLRLVAEDTAQDGPMPALRRLLDRPVHMLVGSMPGEDRGEVLTTLRDRHVASLAGLTPHAGPGQLGDWAVDLLPTRGAQQAALARAMEGCRAAEPACTAVALAEAAPFLAETARRARLRVVLPFPAALLDDPWRKLGRAAGRVAVECLARSGSTLHERAALSAALALDGFEPHPGAPAQPARLTRTLWHPAVLTIEPAQPRKTGDDE